MLAPDWKLWPETVAAVENEAAEQAEREADGVTPYDENDEAEEEECHMKGHGHEVEHFRTDAPEATEDPLVVKGYCLKWDSTADTQRGMTRFQPSAFGTASRKVPLLWQHDEADPIGVAIVTPDAKGLRIEARLADTQRGRDIATLMRTGGINAFSIGAVLTAQPGGKDGVRIVTSATLKEVSIVTFPADRAARAATVGGDPVPAQFSARLTREQVEVEVKHAEQVLAEARTGRKAMKETSPSVSLFGGVTYSMEELRTGLRCDGAFGRFALAHMPKILDTSMPPDPRTTGRARREEEIRSAEALHRAYAAPERDSLAVRAARAIRG